MLFVIILSLWNILYCIRKVVYLVFEVFKVATWREDCPGDVLLIYDGWVAEEADQRICGHQDGWEWMTATGEVLLKFISDSTNTDQGFSLQFTPIKVSPTGTGMTPPVYSPQIARFMGPTWGLSGADRIQVGPILVPWTLLSASVPAYTQADLTPTPTLFSYLCVCGTTLKYALHGLFSIMHVTRWDLSFLHDNAIIVFIIVLYITIFDVLFEVMIVTQSIVSLHMRLFY